MVLGLLDACGVGAVDVGALVLCSSAGQAVASSRPGGASGGSRRCIKSSSGSFSSLHHLVLRNWLEIRSTLQSGMRFLGRVHVLNGASLVFDVLVVLEAASFEVFQKLSRQP